MFLNGDIHDKNDFENTNAVEIKDFYDFRQLKDGFTATLSCVQCRLNLLLK